MDIFECPGCGGRLFFNDLTCTCGQPVMFNPDNSRFLPAKDGAWCANRSVIGCNWQGDDGGLCRACGTTRTRPDLSVGRNLVLWAEAESAKRRSFYDLMHWGLFTRDDRFDRPIFDLLAEETRSGEVNVTMGHADGVITINVDEADAAEREARRIMFQERYRSMLGHFRHEIGHLVFLRLSGQAGFLEAFRALFGDERADYAKALKQHYAGDPPRDWDETHLTRYATAHPHEDWAETFAHFLHLVALTASAEGADLSSPALSAAGPGFDVYKATRPEPFLTIGAELSVALNHVTRAIGLPDPYPFVLTDETREKLAFVQSWIRAAA